MLTCSLAWQTEHCTPWRKCQGFLFPGFVQTSSMHLLFDELPNWLVDCTTTCMAHWRSDYAQLTPLYLLSTLSITYVLNYSRHSPTFPYGKHQKDGRGLGTSLVTPQWNHSTHKSYADYSHSVHSQPTTRGRVQTLSTNILRLHFKGRILPSLQY